MFGTSGIRGPVGEAVTAELALSVGRAVASRDADRVVVGRDARASGEFLQDALTAGIRECGADVIDLGLAATPTIARSVAWHDAAAGVAITASHNPPPDNGFKLWDVTGQAFDVDQRADVTRRLSEEDFSLAAWDAVGSIREYGDAAADHLERLTASASGSLSGDTAVVVDLGNGVGQVSVDALDRLGCSVETLNATPDGRFPGRPSEPTAETLTSLRALVANADVDLGIAHDGDADRMVAVDETGSVVPGDVLLALFARAAVRGASIEDPRVAAPVNTSLAVEDALAAVGGSVTYTAVGDVHVAEECSAPDVVFGGEPSGAWIWPAETLCPDGPLAACKLVELVERNGPLAEQVAGIETYPLRRESVPVDDRDARMQRIAEDILATHDDVITTDGVRIDHDDGWVLIRASGTQPLIRVTTEARTDSRSAELAEWAIRQVEDAA